MPSTPAKITVDQAAQTLTIIWQDGLVSAFPLDGLRRACPCATCRGGHEQMNEAVDPMLFKLPSLMTWTIDKMQPVGNYALQIFWNDGHASGIYSWDRLREWAALLD